MKTLMPEGTGLPEPTLFLCDPAWGANSPEHRQKLRTRLVAESRQHGLISAYEAESWVRLDQLPRAGKIHCSISHAQSLGGFVLAQIPVGFDIEIAGRVSKRAIERVSTPKEVQSAPSADHLWCAKEAAFKCLQGENQPTTVSQIEIHSWRPSSQRSFIYEAAGGGTRSVALKGVTWPSDAWIFSLCFLNSSI